MASAGVIVEARYQQRIFQNQQRTELRFFACCKSVSTAASYTRAFKMRLKYPTACSLAFSKIGIVSSLYFGEFRSTVGNDTISVCVGASPFSSNGYLYDPRGFCCCCCCCSPFKAALRRSSLDVSAGNVDMQRLMADDDEDDEDNEFLPGKTRRVAMVRTEDDSMMYVTSSNG
jgi:hypothetical protein